MSDKLDRTRTHGTHEGEPHSRGACFFQDHKEFDAAGNLIGWDPLHEPREAKTKTAKAPKAKPPRKAKAPAAANGDDPPVVSDETGPINPHQNWLKFRAEVQRRTGVLYTTKADAMVGAREAGLLPGQEGDTQGPI